MGGKDPVTPMMRQYQEIKAQHPDEILFFRLGDFYEMFDDDAIEVSRLLNLTLTHRGSAPMCGIPYHAATSYLKRLLDAGRKVAVCEQLTLPESSRELARREVVQVYTPGTVVEDEYLDSFKDNYVFCVDVFKGQCVTAFADLSSGSFFASKIAKSRFDRPHQCLRLKTAHAGVKQRQDVPDDRTVSDVSLDIRINFYAIFLKHSFYYCPAFFHIVADQPYIPVSQPFVPYKAQDIGRSAFCLIIYSGGFHQSYAPAVKSNCRPHSVKFLFYMPHGP